MEAAKLGAIVQGSAIDELIPVLQRLLSFFSGGLGVAGIEVVGQVAQVVADNTNPVDAKRRQNIGSRPSARL